MAFFFFFLVPVDLAGSDLLDSGALPAWEFLSTPPQELVHTATPIELLLFNYVY